jgi:hypothetical protein
MNLEFSNTINNVLSNIIAKEMVIDLFFIIIIGCICLISFLVVFFAKLISWILHKDKSLIDLIDEELVSKKGFLSIVTTIILKLIDKIGGKKWGNFIKNSFTKINAYIASAFNIKEVNFTPAIFTLSVFNTVSIFARFLLEVTLFNIGKDFLQNLSKISPVVNVVFLIYLISFIVRSSSKNK